jgi:Holliday junction resolvase
MSNKSKGINGERDLVHRFWAAGWSSVRVAGSGSSRYPSPDILAANVLRKLAIEAKVINGENKYLSEDDVRQLEIFAENFGAEPWIAVRFSGNDWYFMPISELGKSGKNYVISLKNAKIKGLLFEELIK